MPAVVMDIEAPSSSEKQMSDAVMEEVQSSAPNLLFEGSLDTAGSNELFSGMPDLDQENMTTKSVNSSDLGFVPSIGPLHRSSKDIESPSAFHGCCGFYNLGNTCFMNAGLQCLFCNTHLVKYFHEQFVLDDLSKETLTGKFCQLVRKVWSGHFSLIHPLDFKTTLGIYYPQFQDFRQHDCQEFVTLLLDNLHESLNNVFNNNKSTFHKPLPSAESLKEPVCTPVATPAALSTITTVAISSLSSSVSSSSATNNPLAPMGSRHQNQNNSHVVSSSQVEPLHSFATNPAAFNTLTRGAVPNHQADRKQAKLSMPGSGSIYQGCSNSGLKKPFHFTPNQLYTQSNNNTSTTMATHSSSSNQTEVLVLRASNSGPGGGEGCGDRIEGRGTKAQISSLRNFDSSPQKDNNNQMAAADSSVSSSTQLFPSRAANSNGTALVSAGGAAAATTITNNRPSTLLACSQQTNLLRLDDQFLVHSTNVSDVSGGSTTATTLTLASKCLPSLEDFYAKETKTLNTNMLASESEEQIQTDSEKFFKSDNRNRLNAENCDNNIEQILGAEAAKADLGPGIEKVKDINIRLDKKARSHQNYLSSCKSGLRYEDWSNINNIKRIKIDADSDEKNMKRQALQKFNLEQNTVRSEEIMVVPGCSTAPVEEEEEDDDDDDDRDEEDDEEEEGESIALEKEEEDANYPAEKEQVRGGGGLVTDRNCLLPEYCGRPEEEAITAADIEAADSSWDSHLIKNNSIVVNTFHGQFKNTVVCSECCHVSVTYEPFMYLSVPIPHAMERQLCVIFMTQARSIPPTRYLLKLHKNDNVYKAKTELRNVASQQNCDLIMVEVVNSHITRVLDDNILLRFVNDSARKIYAFEMTAPPSSLDSSPSDSLGELSTVSSSLGTKDTSVTRQACSSTSPDIFSNMDTYCPGSCAPQEESKALTTTTAATSIVGASTTVTDAVCGSSAATQTADSCHPSSTNISPNISQTQHQQTPPVDCFPSSVFPDSAMKDDSSVCDSSSITSPSKAGACAGSDSLHPGQLWDWPPTVSSPGGTAIPMSWEPNLDTCDQAQQQPVVSSSIPSMAEHWRSCAICLEELLDTSLMVHTACGGTFCHSCLEMSLKHHSVFSYTCPVCLAFANPSVEFVPLADPDSKRLRTRILAVPLAFRCLSKTDPEQQHMIGHPHILYLPNNISGSVLYSCVDQVVHAAALHYTIVYTTEEGLQCSRCPAVNQCDGCSVQRTSRVTLQPGDHLTIVLGDVPATRHDQLLQQYVIDHESMVNLRPDAPMTIYDCFRAFMQSETLDEHNPWYCPNCGRNCRAKKTMTVWRYPDNLIIYLKRFVFHELTSTKIDNLVTFPLGDLDLGQFSSGPRTKHLLYNLHSFVCHFGGSNSGHYTCYSKHPTEDSWYYYNDETVCQQVPRDDHLSSAYVLFYVRQDTNVSFKIPDKSSYHFIDSLTNNPSPPAEGPQSTDTTKSGGQSMALVLYQPQPMIADTSSLYRPIAESSDSNAKNPLPGSAEVTPPTERVEPDSTYDFYS